MQYYKHSIENTIAYRSLPCHVTSKWETLGHMTPIILPMEIQIMTPTQKQEYTEVANVHGAVDTKGDHT